MKDNICIVIEKQEGYLAKNAYNIVSYISGQFQKESTITVICIGGCSKQEIEELKKLGISELIIVELNDVLSFKFQKKSIIDFIENVLKKYKSSLAVFMATNNGRMLAARLAIRFSCGLVAECVNIRKGEGKSFVFQRAALSGTVIAEIVCVNSCIQMCTVKNIIGSIFHVENNDNCIVRVVKQKLVKELNFDVEKIETIRIDQDNDLENSNIIFGIGSGVKKGELTKRVNYIATKLGASIGYTRGFVELNEENQCMQIGQSGKLVSPKLYIAFGISGATQHLVGINNSKCIISINKDRDASIHLYSDYIIIEDAEMVINLMYDIIKMISE